MGIFSGVRLLETPSKLAIGFVIRLRFDLADENTHTLRLRVTHPDGKERWLALPNVTPEPTGEESFAFPVIEGKLPLVVEAFGDYVVGVGADSLSGNYMRYASGPVDWTDVLLCSSEHTRVFSTQSNRF